MTAITESIFLSLCFQFFISVFSYFFFEWEVETTIFRNVARMSVQPLFTYTHAFGCYKGKILLTANSQKVNRMREISLLFSKIAHRIEQQTGERWKILILLLFFANKSRYDFLAGNFDDRGDSGGVGGNSKLIWIINTKMCRNGAKKKSGKQMPNDHL